MIAGLDGLRFSHWKAALREDGVLVLSFDRQGESVNTFAQDVLIELDGLLERLALDPPRGLVLASAKDKGFIAGADIREFAEFDARGTIGDSIHRGQQVFQRLADLPCPTVAAIHGFCMGGGTEISLACDYRVASNDDSTRIGLPEVKLGIYPGWGGSVRLPRLVGAPAAFDMMLTGRALSAKAARGIGLVDKVAEPALLLDAAAGLALNGTTRPFKQRFMGWATNTWPVRQALAPILVKQVAGKARREHYPAPYSLIETWRRSGGGLQSKLDAERRSVVKLAGTPTARNLTRVYFLQERLKGLGTREHGVERVHVLGAGALLASNTSSIPLDTLAPGLQRPAQFAGLHYFNPVALMPLVEIVRHEAMAADTQDRLAGFCRATGKLPVPVAGSPGFLVNRLLFPYMLEAATAYAEGIPGAAIDRAAVKFGMPMGPIELIDTVGLDVAAGVAAELAPFLGLRIPAALAQPPEAGKRGKKDGQGLYAWEDGKAKKPELPKDYRAPDDLEDRLVLALLNEAVAALADGVVDDADLLDAGVIFGTGFAPFRGGPIQHIRDTGADKLLERLKALQGKYGERFAPRPGWDNPALRP